MSILAAAYVPTGIGILVALGTILVALILAGYTLQRLRLPRRARAALWIVLIVGTAGVEWLCSQQPPGLRMLALISFALLVMKVIVLLEERAQGMAPLSFARWLGFSAGWIGMQPRFFASPAAGPLVGAVALMRHGLGLAISGAVLRGTREARVDRTAVAAARVAPPSPWPQPDAALRRVQHPGGGVAAPRRSVRGALSRAAPLAEPRRVLGEALEPGVLRNDGDCRLSSARRVIRKGPGTAGGVRPVRRAARVGDQRAGSRRLRTPAPLFS